MKIILSILTLASVLFVAIPIQAAGLGNPETIALTSTNAIAATSTNSSASVPFSVQAGKDVAIGVRFKGVGADTGNLVLKLSKQVGDAATEDGTFFSWTIAANGTNYVSAVTNLTVNAVPKLSVTYIANTSTNALTNVVVTVFRK